MNFNNVSTVIYTYKSYKKNIFFKKKGKSFTNNHILWAKHDLSLNYLITSSIESDQSPFHLVLVGNFSFQFLNCPCVFNIKFKNKV